LFSCCTVSPTTVEDDVTINSMTGLLTVQEILESEVAVGDFFILRVSFMCVLHKEQIFLQKTMFHNVILCSHIYIYIYIDIMVFEIYMHPFLTLYIFWYIF